MNLRAKSVAVAMIVALSLGNFAFPTQAATKTGKPCKKLGQKTTSLGVKYQCQKFGSKKFWAPRAGAQLTPIVKQPVTTPTPTPTSIATPVYYQPKIGDCFNYDWNQASLKNVSDQPISCQSQHTAETYKVQNWDSPVNVYQATDEVIQEIAKAICTPFSYKPNTSVNFWVYSFPSESQWNVGNKWIRCDAVTLDRSGKIPRFISWQGEPPQKQITPATCTVESAKSYVWTSGDEYAQRRVGFYLRNSSPDRDATLVRITATFRYEDGTTSSELFEISRIPAGQAVGVGKVFEASMPSLGSWTYSAKCSDSPMGRVSKLIELSGTVKKDTEDSRYGLEYSASGVNSYPDVIRCKNDYYSCLIYVLFYDNVGGIAGGDTIFLNGPIYPNDSFNVLGSIYFPKSWHPERISSFRLWVQEPQ
jgi:hypothetical protein